MNNWLINIQSVLFGKSVCLLCHAACNEDLCNGCRDDLSWMPVGTCQCCAVVLPSGQFCGQCLRVPPNFDTTLAVFQYVDPVEWMIKRLKFDGDLIYGRVLGNLMGDSLPHRAGYCRPDVILPVPLHATRLKKRGYNQSLALASALGKKLAIEVNSLGVQRRLATAEQSGLSAKQRQRNIVNAFYIKDCFANKTVALVDDVMTTGATVNELAKQLKKAEAARVDVWVCARS